MEQNAPEQAAWPRMTRIFTVSLGLMMFEITLVRLFSVIMWYHLAFFVLAIALFGFGLGGLYAQIWRRGGKGAAEPGRLHAFLPIFIACAIVSALVLLVLLPLNTASEMYQVPRIRWILCAFLIAAAPFFFGSIYMAQLFAARPAEAGRLYFADLLGAALGCVCAMALLEWLGGLSAPFVIAAVVILPAFVGGRDALLRRILAAVLVVFFLGLGTANVKSDVLIKAARKAWQGENYFFYSEKIPTLLGTDFLFSKWNFYSRIGVSEWPDFRGWRLSANYDGPIPHHYMISQDGRAPAFIVAFDGDLEKVDYLRYDVPSLAFRMQDVESVLVIGVGGGRDLLTARLYGVPHIKGVELNPITANDVMREAFVEESGNIYGLEGIDVVVDSGRTFAYTDEEFYDAILVSFADNQAASSQGAAVLAENHLYTQEAFQSYYRRLSERGICGTASSAMWSDHFLPRMVNTYRAALEAEGVENPERHILAVYTPKADKAAHGMYIAMSKRPVDEALTKRARAACDDLGYTLVWPPQPEEHFWTTNLARIFDPAERDGFLKEFEADVSVMRDNRPYVEYAIKPSEFPALLLRLGKTGPNLPPQLEALAQLMGFFLVIFACVLVLMVSPLLLLKRDELKDGRGGRLVLLGIFFFLGVAYMLIQIALLQQFFLLLGDPAITFAVMLAAMLFFTGVGSLISQRFSVVGLHRRIGVIALLVALIHLTVMFLLPPAIYALLPYPQAVKICAVVLLLALVSTPMGMLFPSALRMMHQRGLDMTCWAWGMNGVGSVLGSVGATLISLNIGIQGVFIAGAGCYAVVLALARRVARNA